MRKILTLYWINSILAQDFSKCGRSTLKETPIKDGIVADREHPHMCTLSLAHGDFNVFAGAGSLISSNMVLSLASGVSKFRGGAADKPGQTVSNLIDFRDSPLNPGSCDKDGGNLTVVCGDVNLLKRGPGRQDRRVSNILIHPEFDPNTLINDFAVLVLDQPFELTEYVGTICLPDPELQAEDSQEKVKKNSCVGLGHGTNSQQAYSTELRTTKILPLKSREECEDALNKNHFVPNHKITWTAHPSHLCAGGEEYSDTCEGDGGGPLVCAAIAERREPEDEILVAGEGGAAKVDNPDPIFGDFAREYDTVTGDIEEGDEVFGDLDDVEYESSVFDSYEDEPCDDAEGEDALDLRTSSLCKKGAGDSPEESVEKESDVLGLRTVDKKKRSADAQSEDVFGGYDYSDETDELFGGDNIYEEYPDIYPVDSFVNREGDSEDIRLIQLGVVAWGIGCGREGLPSVYSSVASARCWLDQVMSCYQPTPGTSDSVRKLIDLRSAPLSPASVGGYSEEQCGAWAQGAGAQKAACGCKQKLKQNESVDDYPDYYDNDNELLGLREATLDLRKKRKTGE